MPRYVLLDPDRDAREHLTEALASLDLDVQAYGAADLACAAVESIAPEVVLLALRGCENGMFSTTTSRDVVQYSRESIERLSRATVGRCIPIVAFGAQRLSSSDTASLRSAGANAIVPTVDIDVLRAVIDSQRAWSLRESAFESALDRARAATWFTTGLPAPNSLPNRSVAGARLRDRLVAAASDDRPVLLRGGHERAPERYAEMLHHGRERGAPFVRFDALEPDADAQRRDLFGHGRQTVGRAGVGAIALAEAGTLFVNGADQLSPEVQAELVSSMEEGRVRVVASVDGGALVPSLANAFANIAIDVPSLAEMRADLPILIADGLGAATWFRVTRVALDALADWTWPGDRVEFDHELARLRGLPERRLELSDLDLRIREGAPPREPTHMAVPPASSPVPWVPAAAEFEITDEDPIDLSVYERKAVLRALHAAGGNRTRAAAVLGVGKSTLYRKLTKFGLV